MRHSESVLELYVIFEKGILKSEMNDRNTGSFTISCKFFYFL